MPDLKELKEELDAQRLRRKALIEAIEEYLNLVTTKLSGGTLLGAGIVEFLSPDVIAAILPQPLAISGVGFALLAGKKGAKAIVDALGQFLK